MISRWLEYFRHSWNTFDGVGIPLGRAGIPLYRVEMLSKGLKCFLKGCNAFYSAGMLSTGLKWCLQDWNAIDRVGISLYTVEMHSGGLR
jgi:hypothetical protein